MEPQLAANASGIAQHYQGQHPPTLQMVKEALRAHDEKKGASVVAIKRFILAKYPSVDPIRLKYLLKQALSKGLSCGELVRPHNSSAVGATGTFKLAHKRPRLKRQLGQADADGEQSPAPGHEGTAGAPAAGAQRGAEQQPAAAKKKAKAVKAQPRAAEKPRSERAKLPPAADRARAPGAGGRRQGPGKGRPQGPAPAAESTAGSDSPERAGLKGPRKAPRAKSKGKAPKGAQQDAPEAQGGQDQAKKPRVTPGAGRGKARLKKAAPTASDRKAP